MRKVRDAFTMIELIMVIVVLGIVGMIVTEVLAQAYKGAFYQQKYAEREVELERVLNIIEKRLKDALVDSIVLLDKNDVPDACEVIGSQPASDDAVAAFIAVDRDGMNGLWTGGRYQNGWSEQGALSVIAGNTVVTSPDANFSVESAIIPNVYPGRTLAGALTGAAIYRYPIITAPCNDFRWTTAATGTAMDKISGFNAATPTQLVINGTVGLNSQQMYRLASTAVAFKRNDGPAGNEKDGTLLMYTNFQPWNGEDYNTSGTASLVSEHVSHFAIRLDSGAAHTIVGNPSLNGAFYRINVCMKVVSDTKDTSASTDPDQQDQICKEKSVYVR